MMLLGSTDVAAAIHYSWKVSQSVVCQAFVSDKTHPATRADNEIVSAEHTTWQAEQSQTGTMALQTLMCITLNDTS